MKLLLLYAVRILPLLLIVLLFALPVLAQEEPPPPPEPGSFEEFLETLGRVLAGIAFFGAPLTLLIVQILKFVIPVPPAWLQLLIGLILTIIYWVATFLGLQTQFKTVVDLALAIGPMILTLLGTLFGSGLLYRYANRTHTPFFGYSQKG